MTLIIALLVIVAGIACLSWLTTHAARGAGKMFAGAIREINQSNPEREK